MGADVPMRTHKNHLTGRTNTAFPFKVVTEKPQKEEMTLTGNAINPQEELRKLNDAYTKLYETQTQYSHFVRRVKTILGPSR